MGKHPQRREKEQMQVKGINQMQNLRELSVKSILPPLIWLNIHLANKQSKQWGKKLVTISDQIKMNHWMTLNCKTGESGFILQSCVWLVMKSHLLYCLPQYTSFPFSALVSYRSYGPVLAVDTSVLKSEEWQSGMNENIPQSSSTLTDLVNCPSKTLVLPVSIHDVWQIFASGAVVHVSCQSSLIKFLSAMPTSPSLPPLMYSVQ